MTPAPGPLKASSHLIGLIRNRAVDHNQGVRVPQVQAGEGRQQVRRGGNILMVARDSTD
jgi:hypothetical protein